MENTVASRKNTILIYGSLLGVLSIVLALIGYILKSDQSGTFKFLTWLIYIVAIILGIKHYRDKGRNGFISYGNAVGTGVLISLVGGIIFSIYLVLLVEVIDPDYITNIMQKAQDAMIEQGQSEEQIRMALKIQRKFSNPIVFALMGIVGSLFTGLITSLIVSIFLKKNDNTFEGQFQ